MSMTCPRLGLRHNPRPGPGFNPKDLIQDLNLVQDQVQEALGPGSGLGPTPVIHYQDPGQELSFDDDRGI